MFQRFVIPLSLALVLGLIGSAFGELNYEYYEAPAGSQYNALADVQFGVATPTRVGTSDTLNSGNGDWDEQAGGHRGEDFAFRFFGYIVIPVSGETTFYLRSDDGSQLFINGTMVIDNDGLHGTEGWPGDPGAITLDAGAYTIEATMFERGGGDSLHVAWSHGGFDARRVQDSVLFLEPPADISVVPPTVLVEVKAGSPDPSDGAIDSLATALAWTAGYGAATHRVYLSTDATIDDADLLAETDLMLQPAILDPGTSYSWRVDEVDADGNVVEGDVWSFTTLPLEAHFPSPPDGSTNVISAQLSWTGGKDAIMHNVNFGTDPAALLPVSTMQMDTSYDAGALDPGTTYYWRVDEFTPVGTVNGPVWSFSTIGAVTPIEEPGLVLRYQFDEDASSLAALDVSGNGHHGAITGTAWVDGLEGGALDTGGVGYVDVPAESWSTIENQATITFWAYGDPDLLPRNNSVFWADDGGNRVFQAHLPWGNGNVYFDAGGAGYDRINKGASADEYEGSWRHWTFLKNAETGDQQIYLDGDLWHSGTGMTMPMTGVVSFTIGSAANHGNLYPGMLDDFRLYNTALPIEEIRVLAGVEELPYGPAPADGEIDLETAVTLTWNPAQGAVEQDVYLGTDEAAVAAADATDTTGIYVGRQAETDSALADLGRGVTYFWRVDGVKADGTVMPGLVWNFRVLDRNTDNWADAVDPDYLNTYVQNGAYDVGALSGDVSYEFIVKSNPDVTPSSALIGRIGHGDTTAALKYEQYNDTGNYGATVFGVADHDYGVATAPGEYTHLVFVSNEAAAATELYVNGELVGSVPTAITLAGVVGIGQAIRDPEGAEFIDPFDGTIFGVAIYDRALTADEIAANADKYFNPIPITDPDLLIYYDFESGEGSMALDQSGHSNHGEFVGTPEWATGPFGGAISISLDDVDYLQTAAPLGIVSNTVSVTGWVKLDASPAAWSGILTHRHTEASGLRHNLGLQHDGTELRYMWGDDQYWSFSSGLPLPVGEWYFAALTISPDQGKLYLNGIEQTATNVAPHDPTNFDGPVYVGGDPVNSLGRIQTSLIDEVKLYNRTLTDVDIQKVFLSDVTAPGDVVQGVPNDGDWPGGEHPGLAIDDVVSGAKYLHRKGGSMTTGFQVEPSVGATIVTGLTLTTANDTPGRDPLTFELSGANDAIDGTYELIAAGDIVDFVDWPRNTINATAISFENATAYKYYQLVFPTLAGGEPLMQIAEVELLGVVAPLLVEDFESYAVGTDLHGVNDWEGWEGAAGAGAPISNEHAVSGTNAVEIIGTADLVKKLDITGGQVTLTAMQYIHSGTSGDSFFILMNQYAPNPLDWSPQSKFSLGSGQINDGGGTIVYDQWVELKYVIDLDNNTVDEYYNGAVIRSGQWDNDGHNTLQAIDLYSAGASSVFYDDIVITPGN